jgi:hypothetical protein
MALRDKLMRRDLFEDFCREYVRELSSARTELATAEREIRKLVQAIKDGVPALKGDLAGMLSAAETARGRQKRATSWSK